MQVGTDHVLICFWQYHRTYTWLSVPTPSATPDVMAYWWDIRSCWEHYEDAADEVQGYEGHLVLALAHCSLHPLRPSLPHGCPCLCFIVPCHAPASHPSSWNQTFHNAGLATSYCNKNSFISCFLWNNLCVSLSGPKWAGFTTCCQSLSGLTYLSLATLLLPIVLNHWTVHGIPTHCCFRSLVSFNINFFVCVTLSILSLLPT